MRTSDSERPATVLMDLSGLIIDSTGSAIAERKTSATALAEAFYAKIESDDSKIGAYLILSKERALAKAAVIDALAGKGETLPPLAEVSVGIKDILVSNNIRTTDCSVFLGYLVPRFVYYC